MTHRTRLPRFATAADVDHDIERAQVLCQLQRLTQNHTPGFAGKVFVSRLAVDGDVAAPFDQEHTRHRALAPSRAVVIFTVHLFLHASYFEISSTVGCCAE